MIKKNSPALSSVYKAIPVTAGLFLAALSAHGTPAQASAVEPTPSLVVMNEPLPQDLYDQLYRKPFRAPVITPAQISGEAYYQRTKTVVGDKLNLLRSDLFNLQGRISAQSHALSTLEMNGRQMAATYYANIATINTQLQVGTTPGNPRLIARLTSAQTNLESLSSNVTNLNALAVEISDAASQASFMLETARSTYSLSGAVEEDHVQLAQLEDAINNTVVMIERLLNNINDDITRTTAYLGSERKNLRTLSTAVRTGDLMGKSLANRPFSSVQQASFTVNGEQGQGYEAMVPASYTPEQEATPVPLQTPRPLVKIRFDSPDVDYEQPVYMAVTEALERYPQARFELVAVHPNTGNAAKQAIEGTRSRRNAERVLRTLTEMGLNLDQIDLSYSPSAQVSGNEVHLYIH